MDFAPDADVTMGTGDAAIGSRSVSDDPAVVTRHVMAAARGFLSAGVVPVVKHFPGHGSVSADSHVTLPVQRRSLAELERRDWVPFARAIDAGLPAVMVGHLDVRAADKGVPSSLSRPVVTGILRERLGFDGLVVTDALDMAAVRRHLGPDRAAVAALRAGADVALMPVDPAGARAAIVRAVKGGYLSRVRLEQAAARQVALLLHQQATARPGQARAPGAARPLATRLAAEALTSVAGPCTGRIAPRRPIPFGDPTAVASFRVAAREAGLALGHVDLDKPPRPTLKQKWSKKRKQRVIRRWRRIEPPPVLRGTRIDLVGLGDPVPQSGYVVAVDRPTILGRTDAAVRVATYGDGPGPMRALVAFWLGRAPAPGRLPVEVPGVRRGC
jgi:beta-N-acetylhexosaminidase